jgi:cupin fold WbuC family metalloprotein
MQTRPFNAEVLYPDEAVVKLTRTDLDRLKHQALANQRKRMRLCAHRSTDDALHEMLIVHTPETYVRPHKHRQKSESFHVIEGHGDVILFDDAGQIVDLVPMGPYSGGACFYYRLADPYYHSLVIRSPLFLFHETTNGPFDPSHTIFAPWAPPEGDRPAVGNYLKQLDEAIATYRTKLP